MTVMLASPVYHEGCITTGYVGSMLKLYGLLSERKTKFIWCPTINDAVNRQRNFICALFLASGADILLMVDVDQDYKAEDVLRWIDADLPVIVANYPCRTYDWNRLAGKNVSCLRDLMSTMLTGTVVPWKKTPQPEFHAAPGGPKKTEVEPVEGFQRVARAGTGMMMIRRDVLEGLIALKMLTKLKHPDPEVEKWMHRFFEFTVVDGIDRGEDESFCDKLTAAKYPIYCDVTAICGHVGPHEFRGLPEWPEGK